MVIHLNCIKGLHVDLSRDEFVEHQVFVEHISFIAKRQRTFLTSDVYCQDGFLKKLKEIYPEAEFSKSSYGYHLEKDITVDVLDFHMDNGQVVSLLMKTISEETVCCFD